jgi:hypothetical protein
MTSREFIELTGKFIESEQSLDYFLSLLAKLAHDSDGLHESARQVAGTQAGTNPAMTAHNQLISNLSGVA